MWHFNEQWYWFLEVLDAYSRYLVACEVLITATAQDVVRVEQLATDTLTGRDIRPGEPEIVHDGGPHFIGREWTQFVQATGITDVCTHPYHRSLTARTHGCAAPSAPKSPSMPMRNCAKRVP